MGIGSTGKLKRAWGCHWANLPPEGHRSARRAGTNVTTHRPTIQLPERPESIAPQTMMAKPKFAGQIVNVEAMALEATAHRQSAQGQGNLHQAFHQEAKGLTPPWSRVNLHSIRLQLRQQRRQRWLREPLILGFNQTEWASRQTASTAIAALGQHPPNPANGISRADPFTRA